MTAPPDAHGYVLLDRRRVAPEAVGAVEGCLADLASQGWRKAQTLEGLEVWLGPQSRLQAVQVHRRHLLIGQWLGARPLSAIIGESRSALGLARSAVSQGWGRYVLAWIDDDGRLSLLRDPSGALDCIWWRQGALTAVTSEPPVALDPLLPATVGIDWTGVERLLADVSRVSDAVLISGLSAVSPGELVQPTGREPIRAIWTPAQCFGAHRPWDDDPAALARVLDQTTRALVSGYGPLVAELSGGLDSAITAAALVAAGRSGDTRFVNYFGAWPEGDERTYAAAVAAALGVPVGFAAKTIEPLHEARFAVLGCALRPGLNGLDPVYDADMAGRACAAGATAIVTGQGGDAVLHHDADPAIIVDRCRRLGPRGLGPGYLGGLAQWTRTPVVSLVGRALGRRTPAPPAPPGHRWTRHLDLPPAKAAQIRHLANAQAFWGDCLRSRAADLVQPMLAQPVVEHCLSIPVDHLTIGPRDRGLARLAFAGRLPDRVLERRSKGDLTQHYARVVAASLPVLRPLLLGGRLAAHRLIDPVALDPALTEAALIQHPAGNRHLILAVMESWLRAWEARIARRRGLQIPV